MIIFVDDNSDKRYACCHPLRAAGLTVYEATSGKAALKLLETLTPKVIVSDVGLEDMDGYTLCKLIKKTQKVSFILVSGRIKDEALFKECNADDFLDFSNPFALVATVKRHRNPA